MVVPSRPRAVRLLLDLEPPAWLYRHSVAVAEVAGFLAARAARQGHPVDRRVVETAALLHDLDKALPADDPLRRLGHGHAGAAWLTEHGFEELAPAVAGHPVTRLTDEEHYPGWARSAALEERIVAYADKRAMQRLVPMAIRFDAWRRRYPKRRAETDRAYERALRLEDEVCAAAGVEPADVRRLEWVAGVRRAPGATR